MSAFTSKYKPFIKQAQDADSSFGFEMRALAKIEPILAALHDHWWRIESSGFEQLPSSGPAMIVGNTSGVVPWTALMLIYILMLGRIKCRQVSIAVDMEWIEDERLYQALLAIGFVPWSSANVERLWASGGLAAVFPEGVSSMNKRASMRNRVGEFDWTKFLPAVAQGIKIFPMATLGCDEASPTLFNADSLSRILGLRAFPVSPFFPWLPFPLNLASLPIGWKIHLLRATEYSVPQTREGVQECAKKQALISEGEIQAHLNRLLRTRSGIF